MRCASEYTRALRGSLISILCRFWEQIAADAQHIKCRGMIKRFFTSNVDATKLAAAGMSCGGIEAYEQAQDARVKAIGIFNSGQQSVANTNRIVPPITKSVFFFLGGSSDIAYENVSPRSY